MAKITHESVQLISKYSIFVWDDLFLSSSKWSFDLDTLKWHFLPKLQPTDANYSSTPFSRYGHTVVVYKRKFYLWGGRNDHHRACNRLFCFDPATCQWSIVATISTVIPAARDGHSACVINNRMYIFGGFEDQVWILLEIISFVHFRIRVNNFPMISIISISINVLGISIHLMYDDDENWIVRDCWSVFFSFFSRAGMNFLIVVIFIQQLISTIACISSVVDPKILLLNIHMEYSTTIVYMSSILKRISGR